MFNCTIDAHDPSIATLAQEAKIIESDKRRKEYLAHQQAEAARRAQWIAAQRAAVAATHPTAILCMDCEVGRRGY